MSVGASPRADEGAPTRSLDWLHAHLERREGVRAWRDGGFVSVQARGRQAVHVVWDEGAETFALYSGDRHGEQLMPDPALAAEQVMMLVEAPPPPWPAES